MVHYVPIGTTLLSVAFMLLLLRRASRRAWAPHLLWWAGGIACYGLGTAIESAITLHGNTPTLFRWWYWAGAILGGYPLATGSVYLLYPRRLAHVLTALTLLVVLGASVAVFLSPVNATLIEATRPSGKALDWQWIRWLTPLINSYAALFLIGGAVHSSVRFFARGDNPGRAVGTALIAFGALLPGIGGSLAKADLVEFLYIGEFLGIILIWIGYEYCIRAPRPTPAPGDPAGGQ